VLRPGILCNNRHGAILKIHIAPFQFQNFVAAQSAISSYQDDGFQMGAFPGAGIKQARFL
jgi:hypothetical protein